METLSIIELRQHIVPVVAKRLRSHHDQEDAIQETLLKLHQCEIDLNRNYKAFARTVANHTSINLGKRKARRSSISLHASGDIDDRSYEPKDHREKHPSAAVETTEEIKRLHRAIESLPPNEQQVIRTDLDGLTNDAGATQLGIAPGTYSTRLRRAKRRLKRTLAA